MSLLKMSEEIIHQIVLMNQKSPQFWPLWNYLRHKSLANKTFF
jgi:hypothetical protein